MSSSDMDHDPAVDALTAILTSDADRYAVRGVLADIRGLADGPAPVANARLAAFLAAQATPVPPAAVPPQRRPRRRVSAVLRKVVPAGIAGKIVLGAAGVALAGTTSLGTAAVIAEGDDVQRGGVVSPADPPAQPRSDVRAPGASQVRDDVVTGATAPSGGSAASGPRGAAGPPRDGAGEARRDGSRGDRVADKDRTPRADRPAKPAKPGKPGKPVASRRPDNAAPASGNASSGPDRSVARDKASEGNRVQTPEPGSNRSRPGVTRSAGKPSGRG